MDAADPVRNPITFVTVEMSIVPNMLPGSIDVSKGGRRERDGMFTLDIACRNVVCVDATMSSRNSNPHQAERHIKELHCNMRTRYFPAFLAG